MTGVIRSPISVPGDGASERELCWGIASFGWKAGTRLAGVGRRVGRSPGGQERIGPSDAHAFNSSRSACLQSEFPDIQAYTEKNPVSKKPKGEKKEGLGSYFISRVRF